MIYKPKPVNDTGNWEDVIRQHDENFNLLMQCDRNAKRRGTVVGRVIEHPYADGKAYYQVIKEGKRTVQIKVCTGLGDDWVVPAWGRECSIPKETALRLLTRQEKLTELFGGGD